jgi:hypothetical protein
MTGLTQFGPGGGGGRWGGGGGGRGGGGGFNQDPNQRWMQYTGGADVWRRSAITDPNMLQRFDMIAGMVGSTNGEITKEQYVGMTQRFAQGRGAGGPPGAAPTGPGQPPGPGAPGAGPGGGGNTDAFAENAFRRLDKNGDGLLNYDEMPEELRNEKDKWDENKDGFIDLKEFKAYFQARMQQWQAQRGQAGANGQGDLLPPAPSPIEEEEAPKPIAYRAGKLPPNLPAWFAQLDTDKDGQVGLYEWKASGRPIKEFLDMDLDNDGFLTVHEVLKALGLDKQVAGQPAAGASPGGFGAGALPPGGTAASWGGGTPGFGPGGGRPAFGPGGGGGGRWGGGGGGRPGGGGGGRRPG